jgi:hypothetical protein
VARINGKEVVLDETFVTQVSLAVALIDTYTDEHPIGRTRVFLRELSQEGIQNPSGYFLFLNLPDGSYTLRVESEHYRDEELMINIPTSPPGNPLVNIFLEPRPSYPFPPGITLIRGLVRDAAGNPIIEARAEVVGKNIISRSGNKGEFVLFFGGLKEGDIIKENSKRFIRGNGTKVITLKVDRSAYGSKTTQITEGVEEGKTTSVLITF